MACSKCVLVINGRRDDDGRQPMWPAVPQPFYVMPGPWRVLINDINGEPMTSVFYNWAGEPTMATATFNNDNNGSSIWRNIRQLPISRRLPTNIHNGVAMVIMANNDRQCDNEGNDNDVW